MASSEPADRQLPKSPAPVRRRSVLQLALSQAQDVMLVHLLVRDRWLGAFINRVLATLDEEPRQDPLESMKDRR